MVVDWSSGVGDRRALEPWLGKDAIAVANKVDRTQETVPAPWIPVSVTGGTGLPALLARICARSSRARLGTPEAPALTRARHRHAATETIDAIRRAIAGLETGVPIELPAEDLRLAARSLGRITGKVDIDDLLDAIFREFCLGK